MPKQNSTPKKTIDFKVNTSIIFILNEKSTVAKDNSNMKDEHLIFLSHSSFLSMGSLQLFLSAITFAFTRGDLKFKYMTQRPDKSKGGREDF